MMDIRGNSAEEIFHKVLIALREEGLSSAPRGLKIKELINCCITLSNPRDRIISCPERNFSPAYAFGELAWYLSGRNDLEMMKYYSKFMEHGTDDGKTLNSAYGYRMFSGKHPQIQFNQWENVKRLLIEDRDSRQAIIHLHTPNDKKTNDEVCTIALQFLIRNGKLDMITTMRSNDIVLGFTYDVFSFTMLQEILANELGVELGTYYHNAGSMHIYENKFELLEKATMSILPAMEPFKFGLEGFDWMINMETTMRLFANNPEYPIDFFFNSQANVALSHASNLMCFAALSFLIKCVDIAAAESNKIELQNDICNSMRKRNETYADILMLQSKKFGHGGMKVIVEGIDGAGKSEYIKDLILYEYADWDQENCCHIQHYCKPSENFGYYANYLYNMQTDVDTIFDRFFPSEFVYSLSRNTGSRINAGELELLAAKMDKKKTKFVFIVAQNDEQMQMISDRLGEEDEDKKACNLCQNNAYRMLADIMMHYGFMVEMIIPKFAKPQKKKASIHRSRKSQF